MPYDSYYCACKDFRRIFVTLWDAHFDSGSSWWIISKNRCGPSLVLRNATIVDSDRVRRIMPRTLLLATLNISDYRFPRGRFVEDSWCARRALSGPHTYSFGVYGDTAWRVFNMLARGPIKVTEQCEEYTRGKKMLIFKKGARGQQSSKTMDSSSVWRILKTVERRL